MTMEDDDELEDEAQEEVDKVLFELTEGEPSLIETTTQFFSTHSCCHYL